MSNDLFNIWDDGDDDSTEFIPYTESELVEILDMQKKYTQILESELPKVTKIQLFSEVEFTSLFGIDQSEYIISKWDGRYSLTDRETTDDYNRALEICDISDWLTEYYFIEYIKEVEEKVLFETSSSYDIQPLSNNYTELCTLFTLHELNTWAKMLVDYQDFFNDNIENYLKIFNLAYRSIQATILTTESMEETPYLNHVEKLIRKYNINDVAKFPDITEVVKEYLSKSDKDTLIINEAIQILHPEEIQFQSKYIYSLILLAIIKLISENF